MSESKRLRTLLKSTSVLVLVFGLYQLFLLPLNFMRINPDSNGSSLLEIIKLYYEQIMEAFQVISEFKRLYRRKQYLHSNTENRRQSAWMNNTHETGNELGEQHNEYKPIEKVSRELSIIPKRKSNSFTSRFVKLIGCRSKDKFQRPSGPRRPSPLCRSE
ncbi:unnamed protein product [Trichobilharzia regenti]|nr:unnamed protein product [Trichobilharzia regenti]